MYDLPSGGKSLPFETILAGQSIRQVFHIRLPCNSALLPRMTLQLAKEARRLLACSASLFARLSKLLLATRLPDVPPEGKGILNWTRKANLGRLVRGSQSEHSFFCRKVFGLS